MAEKDVEFLQYVVSQLVNNPGDLEIDRTIDDRGVLITLKVNPADMGQIIGKEGKTARALRTLLRVIGAHSDERVNLKIYEPEGSERPVKEATEPTEATESTDGGTDAMAALDDLKL